jgi:hypothetical protein
MVKFISTDDYNVSVNGLPQGVQVGSGKVRTWASGYAVRIGEYDRTIVLELRNGHLRKISGTDSGRGLTETRNRAFVVWTSSRVGIN